MPAICFGPVSRLVARRSFRSPWEDRQGEGCLESCNEMGKARFEE